MTRSQLIAALISRHGHLSSDDVDLATRTVLDHLGDALARGNRVEVRGFGSFALRYRKPHIGRNPQTGEPVAVPGKYVAHFKAGKGLQG